MSHSPPPRTELVESIGCGTLFDVALVRFDGRVVISKRLQSAVRHEAEARAAIVREAKVLSTLRHPSLPLLLEVGSDAHGPFVLETRAEGLPLRSVAEGWAELGRPVPPRLCAHLAAEMSRTLAELGELGDADGPFGFVHGDLGPDNVFLGPLGQVRLIDFGASRLRGLDLKGDDRGTMPFVAPEVARGESAPDARADVYALAATIVFLSLFPRALTRSREEAAMLLELGERGLDATLVEATAFGEKERAALRGALEADAGKRIGARAFASAFVSDG